LEHKLVEDEADLEQVRDSLKGMFLWLSLPGYGFLISRRGIILADKTDEFTTQIEQKQLELEPWSAKISEKQGALNVAISEKTALEARATAGQQAWKDAVQRLEALTEGLSEKVGSQALPFRVFLCR
jgi:structural maintenance of chromosome 4